MGCQNNKNYCHSLERLAKGINEFLEKNRDSLTNEDVRLFEAVVQSLNMNQRQVNKTKQKSILTKVFEIILKLISREDVLKFFTDLLS